MSHEMLVTALAPPAEEASAPLRVADGRARTFDEVYAEHARFLWRAAGRLGLLPHAIEDVVQDVFLVVHRRLQDFEPRTNIRTWLFAILVRVVRDHRRTMRRKGAGYANGVDPDGCASGANPSPLEMAERAEAVAELYAVLDGMHYERREIFVLVELEELSVAEAAQALQLNVNTAYWRLRVARQEFDKVLARRRKGVREEAL